MTYRELKSGSSGIEKYGKERGVKLTEGEKITAVLIRAALELKQDPERVLWAALQAVNGVSGQYGQCIYCGQDISFLNEFFYWKEKLAVHRFQEYRDHVTKYAMQKACNEKVLAKMTCCSRCRNLAGQMKSASNQIAKFMTATKMAEAVREAMARQ